MSDDRYSAPVHNPLHRRLLFLSLLLLAATVVLFGCSPTPAPATPLPEDYLPTAIFLTVQAGNTDPARGTAISTVHSGTPEPGGIHPGVTLESAPTGMSFSGAQATAPMGTAPRTPTPAAPASTPTQTRTPTRTLTPTATRIPIAGIQIFRPGEMSKVVSPIRMGVYLRPGYRGRIWVELYGEDGRLLYREIKVYGETESARINMVGQIEFEIAAVAELGRLVIMVKDEHDRITALNSVDLILLSVGEEDVNTSKALQERVIIQQPQPRNLIQGGNLVVEGLVRQSEARPLVVELRTPGGIAGFRLANIFPVEGQEYARFRAEVPYQVEEFGSALLVVYEDGGTMSEVSYLSSIEVMLSP